MGCPATAIGAVHNLGGNTFDQPGEGMAGLLSDHWRSLYRSAFRYLGNSADAEDAVQDALLSACKHLGQFRGQTQMSTWLTAIVVNSARMQLRKRRRQNNVSLDEIPRTQDPCSLSERLSDGALSPEEMCRRTQLAERVLELAGQLPPPLRTPFQMRELDGLTIRETADMLGITGGAVKARTARARTKLRRLISKSNLSCRQGGKQAAMS